MNRSEKLNLFPGYREVRHPVVVGERGHWPGKFHPDSASTDFFKGTHNKQDFVIAKELRRFVKFRQHNLIDYNDNLPMEFNFIFFRNVLYYFCKQTAAKIVKKLTDRLLPGGLLYVGLTENLQDMNLTLFQVGASVYQKRVE
ncbi:MAG: hypothetical protein MJK10_14295 [Pseudomonadales bacterium]|nr:hypothetical protein [Pseudomonadales bacterium]NRA17052.1 hypothetical protein [Oceanospirillaceae bacterium]